MHPLLMEWKVLLLEVLPRFRHASLRKCDSDHLRLLPFGRLGGVNGRRFVMEHFVERLRFSHFSGHGYFSVFEVLSSIDGSNRGFDIQ